MAQHPKKAVDYIKLLRERLNLNRSNSSIPLSRNKHNSKKKNDIPDSGEPSDRGVNGP